MKIATLNHEAYVSGPGVKQTGAFARLIDAVNKLAGRTGGIEGQYLPVESLTVAELEAIAPTGPAFGYCSNEVGGECAVYYAPTAAVWRRVDTNATIAD